MGIWNGIKEKCSGKGRKTVRRSVIGMGNGLKMQVRDGICKGMQGKANGMQTYIEVVS